MFGIPVLEVATGLVFVYLLFSLLVSAINEAVLGHLIHLRSHALEDGLKSLLSNAGANSSPLGDILRTLWKIISALGRFFLAKKPQATTAAANLAEELIQHPLVKGLATGGQNCPNYLPGNNFANAVVGILLEKAGNVAGTEAEKLAAGIQALGEPYAERLLTSILAEAASLEDARQRLEKWFNDSMDRVSGAYKRNVQFWLYLWATLVVICLNIDTIEITRRLLTDTQFRTVLVNSASNFVNQTNNPAAATLAGQNNTNAASLAAIQSEINNLKLPLGWGASSNQVDSVPGWVLTHLPIRLSATTGGNTNTPDFLVSGILSGAAPCPQTPQDWWLKVLGLLMTVGAVSQGAPFWFDILNKVTNLRAGGHPPKVGKKKVN